MSKKKTHRPILAFVHIEKAAGTTLIYILRRNYLFRYCDVRPLSKQSEGVFRARDLRKLVNIYPFIRCIGGHAVRPFGDLADDNPGIQFITLLRDPVKRYISHYQYLIHEMKRKITFQEFLNNSNFDNFQTRKLAGKEDVEVAMKILADRFLVVGIVEEFDEFLGVLRKKLLPHIIDTRYKRINIARDKQLGSSILNQYNDQIVDRNKLDSLLYEYVNNEITPKYTASAKEGLINDVEVTHERSISSVDMVLRSGTDYFLRKAYLEPVTNVVRMFGGLPAKGSY